MVEIKICGITNEKEIEYLNTLKPEYIGFVFTKSKRQVTPEKAGELCVSLDESIKTVGVFKDNSLKEVLDVIKDVPLDVIQLHGKEDEQYISSLRKNIKRSIKIWKALAISDVENIKNYTSSVSEQLIDNFLIDGDKPGSGEAFSLENISELFEKISNSKFGAKNINEKYSFFLAGGITPENVVQRITKAKAVGVDVSSGVEIIDENGNRTKSFEKMKSLIEKTRTIINA
jgi:phosphoribosylanthranilate isomerase